jgi:hypothetical protein
VVWDHEWLGAIPGSPISEGRKYKEEREVHMNVEAEFEDAIRKNNAKLQQKIIKTEAKKAIFDGVEKSLSSLREKMLFKTKHWFFWTREEPFHVVRNENSIDIWFGNQVICMEWVSPPSFHRGGLYLRCSTPSLGVVRDFDLYVGNTNTAVGEILHYVFRILVEAAILVPLKTQKT